MKINTYHGTYNRSKRSSLTGIKYIVIHYTATDAPAKNNCMYFASGNRNASADYFIDKDGTIWEYNNPKEGYFSWHCGDGKGKYGITNSNSIGIEVVSSGSDYTAEQIAALRELIAYLQSIYTNAKTIVRHYDASRKQCPYPYVNETKWANLKSQIIGGVVSGPAVTKPVVSTAQTTNTVTSSSSAPATGKVAEFQTWMNKTYGFSLAVDNKFGPDSKKKAIMVLQTELNRQTGAKLAVDGSFGPKTKAACINVKQGASGNITRIIQGILYAKGYDPKGFDSKYGPGCAAAVKAFQANNGLYKDAICGPNTFAKLVA